MPFELGRPIGPPDHAEFQMDVVRSLLGLFTRKSGPVLEDFPRESPVTDDTDAAWSCTIPLPALPVAKTSEEALKQALLQEVATLEPWYTESMRRLGRTTFGLSGLTFESMPDIASFLADVAAGDNPEPLSGLSEPLPGAIRYMADDAKAYYMEAANQQPYSTPPGGVRMWTWIYHETRLGEVFYKLRDRLASEYADRTTANGGKRPPGPPPINPVSARFAKQP